MNNKKIHRYIFAAVFLVIIVLSFFVVQPFISAILTAATLAYIFYPLYRKLNIKINNKYVSAALISFFIIMVVSVPLLFAVNALTKEAYVIYIVANQKISQGTLFECQNDESVICQLQDMSTNVKVLYYTKEALKKARDYIVSTGTDYIIEIPRRVIELFVTIFLMFYFFVDGKRMLRRLKNLVPFKKSHADKINARIVDVTYAVVYGNILIALVQGIVGAIGYWIFGITSPLIWGILTFFFGFVPFIGTAFIWIPLSLMTFIQGIAAGNNKILWNGIGLFLYGIFLIGTIDNLIKPKVLSTRTNIHPAIVLLGVLGGISLFGFIGFIVGPLVLAILNTFVKIYMSEFR